MIDGMPMTEIWLDDMPRPRKTLRRKIRDWKERNQIIEDMQRGLYTVTETVRRLDEHSKPGGDERSHVFSCRNGYAPCRCPFKFDTAKYVPLEAPRDDESQAW